MALVQQDLEEQGLHVHVDLVAIRCAGSASSTLLHIGTDCSKPRLAGFHEDALNFSKRNSRVLVFNVYVSMQVNIILAYCIVFVCNFLRVARCGAPFSLLAK